MFWKKKKPKETKSPEFYQKPQDIRQLERDYPVSTKQFSISLLKTRYRDMDIYAQLRADKSIKALETGHFYGKDYN